MQAVLLHILIQTKLIWFYHTPKSVGYISGKTHS